MAFPVWAYGTPGTGGSSASVRFPAGYRVSVAAGRLGRPVTAADGSISLSSGTLADPWSLSAYLVAERPGAFVESPLSVTTGAGTATFTLRAWKGDRVWTTRTTNLLRRAVPALSRALGLAYPGTAPVVIEEVTPRALDGYGAVYDPAAGTIRLAYSASPAALIRAAAHLWLPATTFADRWIVEGLADRATASAAAELKVPAGLPVLGPSLAKAALPLNAWPADPGRTGDARATEAFGLAASGELFKILAGADRVSPLPGDPPGRRGGRDRRGRLPPPTRPRPRPVRWTGAACSTWSRTGAGWTPRTCGGSGWSDPRRLPCSTPGRPLGSTWPPSRRGPVTGGSPTTSRRTIATWRFDQAEERMAEVGAALDARDRLAVAAALAGLEPPAKLRDAYLRSGPDASIPVIDGARTIVEQITAAQDAGTASSTWLDRLGLLGQDPAARLADARSAWQAGDLEAAQTRATEAWQTWIGAADAGGLRLRSVLAVLILVTLGLVYLRVRARARATRREARRDALR